ncbi:MAG TPA: TetR/AcrR family transcriptional regulator C-terminal domain-containing protein [Propionicimonas sp.]|nr:TetR/AcrR family transcriptional regulator C-terminal domain-containing protein [Propionicimonas sp.]
MDRPGLSRDRVIEAAAAVADRSGLVGVTMRSVGAELGVEAMSLYHHVRGKDDLVDGLADWVFALIAVPRPGGEWRSEMVLRAESARAALSAHPWGLGMIESRRAAGDALLRHHDAVLGCLREGGFPVALAAHAFSAIDSYTYGFVLTEVNLPFEPGESADEFVTGLSLPAQRYPYLAEMIAEQVEGRDYAYADEFTYGLDLILDALAARLTGSGIGEK